MKKISVIILIFSLIASQNGCATTKEGSLNPGSEYAPKASQELLGGEKTVFHTEHYTVYTDTDIETAKDVGLFMEKAFKAYQLAIGTEEDLPQFIVNVYATKREYEDEVRKQGLPADITTGMYSPVAPAAVHLSYNGKNSYAMYRNLIHEGTHQYIDQVMSFKQSGKKLLAVPLWLNEGFASYFEGAVTEENNIEPGRVNQERYKVLKRLIRHNRTPSVKEVLSKAYGEPFSLAEYAVSWGIVYVIEKDQKKIMALKEYLVYCKKGFFEDPSLDAFNRLFGPFENDPLELNKEWAGYVAKNSLDYFDKIIAKAGTLEEWESIWEKEI